MIDLLAFDAKENDAISPVLSCLLVREVIIQGVLFIIFLGVYFCI